MPGGFLGSLESPAAACFATLLAAAAALLVRRLQLVFLSVGAVGVAPSFVVIVLIGIEAIGVVISWDMGQVVAVPCKGTGRERKGLGLPEQTGRDSKTLTRHTKQSMLRA